MEWMVLGAVVRGALEPGVNRETWVAVNAVLVVLVLSLAALRPTILRVAPEVDVYIWVLVGINAGLIVLLNRVIAQTGGTSKPAPVKSE